MPIEEFPCPRCGTGVRMGLPRGATVQSVTADATPAPPSPDQKVRTLVCPNGHEFAVRFAW